MTTNDRYAAKRANVAKYTDAELREVLGAAPGQYHPELVQRVAAERRARRVRDVFADQADEKLVALVEAMVAAGEGRWVENGDTWAFIGPRNRPEIVIFLRTEDFEASDWITLEAGC